MTISVSKKQLININENLSLGLKDSIKECEYAAERNDYSFRVSSYGVEWRCKNELSNTFWYSQHFYGKDCQSIIDHLILFLTAYKTEIEDNATE